MNNRLFKSLAITMLALGLCLGNNLFASSPQGHSLRLKYVLKHSSHLPTLTSGTDLAIQLNDHLLLAQATDVLEQYQKQGIIFNKISVSAEDGLTVNLNESFLASVANVLNDKSVLEVGSNVGISTDPDTLLALSKMPVNTLQIDPTAYQSAFTAAPDASAGVVNIQFGTFDQVDAFNKAVFFGSVILNQQTFKITGTAPLVTRFLANLNKPTSKKVIFGELDLNFTSGPITEELARYLGGSVAHESKFAQIKLGSSLAYEQSSLYQASFKQGLDAAIQSGAVVSPRMAIYANPTINWRFLLNSYTEAAGGDPIVFITNGQVKAPFNDQSLQHVTLITAKANVELFSAAEKGEIAGAFVLSDEKSSKRLARELNKNDLIIGETPLGYIAGVSQNKAILEVI